MAKMDGLHVYFNPESLAAFDEDREFYSRRADGPYYRWRYEKKSRRWSFSRVHPSISALRTLRVAEWNQMPAKLRVKLTEHYLE